MTVRYPLELSIEDLCRLADLVWTSDRGRDKEGNTALLHYLEDVIQDAKIQEMEHDHQRMFEYMSRQADNERILGE